MALNGQRALRVVAADDSAVMRGVIQTVFQLHASNPQSTLPEMVLCGVARDGVEALEAVRTLAPDVLLLDLEMPRMNGLGVLERLRSLAPDLPVILCSAQTEWGARATLEALALGARDCVIKPDHQTDFASALDSLMQQLLPRIAALGLASRAPHPDWTAPVEMETESAPTSEPHRSNQPPVEPPPVELVVIGVSTGGPSALELILPLLPLEFAVPILIVQHMPRLFTAALAERLNRLCRLRVEEAAHGTALRPASVWLAPGDAHMEVVAASGSGSRTPVLRLHQGVALNSCKPSVDYLFRSAARLFGSRTLAVVMTGMGADGLNGARAVREAGGTVLAQD